MGVGILVGGLVAAGAALAAVAANSSKKVARHESVTKNSSITSMEEMSEILQGYKKGVHPKASRFEAKAIDMINLYFNDMLTEVKKNEAVFKLINEQELHSRQKQMTDQVHGFITDRVGQRLSLDNEECREIIKMPPSRNKEISMNLLSNKVLREAVDELIKKISSILTDQTNMITQAAEAAAKRKIHEAERQESTFRRMSASWDDKEMNQDKDMLEPQLILYLVQQSRELL